VDYPVWATEISPVTGKWRIETVEINGDIDMSGVRVSPGDIVIADDTGVCFVPIARAAEVLRAASRKALLEQEKCRVIDTGIPVYEVTRFQTDTSRAQ
jgi:regulator of RNase E activity RraA